jgi:hypothetical protein
VTQFDDASVPDREAEASSMREEHPIIRRVDFVGITRNGLVTVRLTYDGHKNVVEMCADDLATSEALERATGSEVTYDADVYLRNAVLPEIPRKLFRAFRASVLDEMEFPEVQWVIPNTLPEGLAVLAGKPKVGKSWWAMGSALDVAETGSVLYLALEDPPRRLQGRMRQVLGAREAPDTLEFRTDWNRLDHGGLEELALWLEEHPYTKLVVIDTIAKIRPKRASQEDQYLGDYNVWGPLQALTITHPSVAIVGVHHQRKGAAEDILDTVLGSQGVTGVADTIMVLKKARGQADGELFITGRDLEGDRERALRFDAGRWTDIGSADDFRVSQERDELLTLLRSEGPQTVTEIARKLGIKFATAWQRARRAEDARKVSKDGDKYAVGS